VGITLQEVSFLANAPLQKIEDHKKSRFKKLAWEDYTGVGGKSPSDRSKVLPEGNLSSYSLGFFFSI